MPSDIEASLIDSGIPASAAKILSSAINDVNTNHLSLGRDTEDATPTSKMRLVDRATRKYILTNLDHPTDETLRDRVNNAGNQYVPRDLSHPYANSQPSTANPTLTTPTVRGGQFIKIGQKTKDDVSQSEVSLKINNRGGNSVRLNKSTGEVEAVPISVRIEPEGLIEGDVIEESGSTVIRLRVTSSSLQNLSGT
jgi:hypothetical protein